ncbi:MAG: NHL repeat-containing protein [Chloroflexota bacterium]
MASSSASSSPQLFHCPTCGASLPTPDSASVTCQYCGSNVLVPPEFRPHKPPEQPAAPAPVVFSVPHQPVIMAQPSRRAWGPILAIVIFLVIIGALVPILLAVFGIFAANRVVTSSLQEITTVQATAFSAPTRAPTATPIPTQTPVPPAEIALQFGGQGSGPGQFEDARSIAVDLDGNLYVAEYLSGRMQKFDAAGKFLQLISVEPDRVGNLYIKDIAVDYQGRLYVVRAADILVFNAADGAQIDTIPGKFPGTNYSALAINLANDLYALHDSAASIDLIRLDPSGKTIWRKESFAAQIDKTKPFTYGGLAVNGLGYTYIVNANAAQVYKFDPDGQFVDRFGSQGSEPGQLNSPQGIAIDPKGRIFITDIGRIEVFDAEGNFLTTIPRLKDLAGIRDLAFDTQGNLYFVTINGDVVKLTLNF